MKNKYSKLNPKISPDLLKIDKKFRKKSRQFIPKLFLALTFLGTGYKIYLENKTLTPELPYKDDQKIPTDKIPSYNELEMNLAKQSYLNLITLLNEKASYYNINLKDYELYNIAFDEVTQNITFIFENNNNFVNLEFNIPFSELQNKINENKSISDQLSSLYVLLKNSSIQNTPIIQKLNLEEVEFYKNLFPDFKLKSISEEKISYGDDRTTEPNNFVNGRDYIYYKLYGNSGLNEEYFASITIAITKDNYEILEIENLKVYLFNNKNNEKIIKNTIIQENNNILNYLNNEIKNIKNNIKNPKTTNFLLQ